MFRLPDWADQRGGQGQRFRILSNEGGATPSGLMALRVA
jgi:hypothetical protein